MKQFDANILADYCRKNILTDNSSTDGYLYRSLSVCIIDCVYSLRAKYFSVTVPIVERYAKKYMNDDKYADGDTLDDFIRRIDSCGQEKFASDVLKNKQTLCKKLKSEVCRDLAQRLVDVGVHTVEDFHLAQLKDSKYLAKVIRGTFGIGEAAESYLFMLAGDSNRCKPDVHLLKCMQDAYGCKVRPEDCQELMEGAVVLLRPQYPTLTVRGLDALIWDKYRKQGTRGK